MVPTGVMVILTMTLVGCASLPGASVGSSAELKESPDCAHVQSVEPATNDERAEEGTNVLCVLILVNGKVGNVKLVKSSGYRRLDDAAVAHAMAQKWKFKPATQNGSRIDSWVVIPIKWTVTKSGAAENAVPK